MSNLANLKTQDSWIQLMNAYFLTKITGKATPTKIIYKSYFKQSSNNNINDFDTTEEKA